MRSLEHVRAVLRNPDSTRQAGFNAESVGRIRMRQPILFQDGPEHKEQRTAIARFFTPKTVSDRYRAMMEALSDKLVGKLRHDRQGDLSQLSMELAVEVAAQVVGLTNSSGMERRLDAFFATERAETLPRPVRVVAGLVGQFRVLRFYLYDVRPAIVARRKAPQEDVISYLLEKGYNNSEILAECLTYAAAGMATTREFICMATWHMLEDDVLRRDYLAADETERHRILQEILRLEPVVGHLYRRATHDINLEDGGETVVIRAGSLINLSIRAANADANGVGEAPLTICPHRELARSVQSAVMSFGDGTHRCPGAFIAIQESDIFLQRLLQLPLRIVREPELNYNELIESYEIRGFTLAVDQ